jgi:very-short-patch-repair endonuclease
LHKGIVVDYYIPEYNLVVEVHGIQHYQPSSFGRDKVDTLMSYNRQLDRDDKLRNICHSNGLRLIEIPYNATYEDILKYITEVKLEYTCS